MNDLHTIAGYLMSLKLSGVEVPIGVDLAMERLFKQLEESA